MVNWFKPSYYFRIKSEERWSVIVHSSNFSSERKLNLELSLTRHYIWESYLKSGKDYLKKKKVIGEPYFQLWFFDHSRKTFLSSVLIKKKIGNDGCGGKKSYLKHQSPILLVWSEAALQLFIWSDLNNICGLKSTGHLGFGL